MARVAAAECGVAMKRLEMVRRTLGSYFLMPNNDCTLTAALLVELYDRATRC